MFMRLLLQRIGGLEPDKRKQAGLLVCQDLPFYRAKRCKGYSCSSVAERLHIMRMHAAHRYATCVVRAKANISAHLSCLPDFILSAVQLKLACYGLLALPTRA